MKIFKLILASFAAFSVCSNVCAFDPLSKAKLKAELIKRCVTTVNGQCTDDGFEVQNAFAVASASKAMSGTILQILNNPLRSSTQTFGLKSGKGLGAAVNTTTCTGTGCNLDCSGDDSSTCEAIQSYGFFDPIGTLDNGDVYLRQLTLGAKAPGGVASGPGYVKVTNNTSNNLVCAVVSNGFQPINIINANSGYTSGLTQPTYTIFNEVNGSATNVELTGAAGLYGYSSASYISSTDILQVNLLCINVASGSATIDLNLCVDGTNPDTDASC